jgi:hypothetical protein
MCRNLAIFCCVSSRVSKLLERHFLGNERSGASLDLLAAGRT